MVSVAAGDAIRGDHLIVKQAPAFFVAEADVAKAKAIIAERARPTQCARTEPNWSKTSALSWSESLACHQN